MPYDWNHNGKHDIGDDYIDYKVYEQISKSSSDNSTKKGCRAESVVGGCLLSLVFIAFPFLVACGVCAVLKSAFGLHGAASGFVLAATFFLTLAAICFIGNKLDESD